MPKNGQQIVRHYIRTNTTNQIKLFELLKERGKTETEAFKLIAEETGLSEGTIRDNIRKNDSAMVHDVAAEALLRRMGKSAMAQNRVIAATVPNKHHATITLIIGNLGGRIIDKLSGLYKDDIADAKLILIIVNGENMVGIEALIKGVEGKSVVIE